MHNKLSFVLILCISTVCLSGCDLLRVAGPCYGVGCPGGTAGHNGQYKPGEAPKAQNASAPAPTKSAAAPAQSASAATQPNIVQPTAPAQPGSAQASNTQDVTPQPAPAQNASAETKPSPFHAIGEFFERLIPHHNSGANSGAGN
ncbi:MAG: hypothetical protein WCF88_13575 [Candidatus Acidiferrales bacterium]|jgi:hypothetical protein